MKRIGFLGSALILSTLGIAACTGNGDDSSSAALAPAIDAGQDSAASEVDASLPADASLPVEAGGDASAPMEAGGDASVPVEAGGDATVPTDATPGEAGTEGGAHDAGDASTPSYALFVGTDFVNAELAVVNLHPDSVAGQLPVADQDSVPFASGGYGFVLEHTVGKVIVLDHAQPWTAKSTIDINDSPDAAGPLASNPRTVLVTTGTKAYVARYASNVVKIVDVASGTVTGSLDLSAFVAPDDSDGLVDVQDAVYDAATGHAYFLLQRINQFDYGTAPDYVAACLSSHGEIVGIDVSNDSLLDLNGAAAGNAIDLLGDNPASLTLDLAGDGRFIVPESGCYQPLDPDAGSDGGPLPRLGRGIESVALSTGTPAWLYQTGGLDRLSGLVWVDATHAFVNQGSDWFAWNPSQTTLGSVIASFPQAPFYDGSRVVGLSFGPPAGSDADSVWSVVALDVGTSQLSTIAGNPFQSVVPASGYGVTSTLLH